MCLKITERVNSQVAAGKSDLTLRTKHCQNCRCGYARRRVSVPDLDGVSPVIGLALKSG